MGKLVREGGRKRRVRKEKEEVAHHSSHYLPMYCSQSLSVVYCHRSFSTAHIHTSISFAKFQTIHVHTCSVAGVANDHFASRVQGLYSHARASKNKKSKGKRKTFTCTIGDSDMTCHCH